MHTWSKILVYNALEKFQTQRTTTNQEKRPYTLTVQTS